MVGSPQLPPFSQTEKRLSSPSSTRAQDVTEKADTKASSYFSSTSKRPRPSSAEAQDPTSVPEDPAETSGSIAAGREPSKPPSPSKFPFGLENPQKDVAKTQKQLPRVDPAFVDGKCTGCGVSKPPGHKQRDHLRYCKGRCERCRDLDLVCIPLNDKHRVCQNCTTAEVPCSGPVTHNQKDLAETKKRHFDHNPSLWM